MEDHVITGSAVISLMDQMRSFFWSLPRLARIVGLGAFIALGLLQSASVFFSSGADIGLSDPWLVGGGLFCFVLWPILIANGYRQLSPAQRRLSYELNSAQIRVRDATGSAVVFPWDVVRSITETNSGFSIAIRPAGARWLPRRPFSADAVNSLRALAAAKLGRNARLKGQA